jgi:hypothetical protein
MFSPGNEFYMNVSICNPGQSTLDMTPVFAVLDVYGELFFAPGFSSFDHYNRYIVPGQTTIPVIPVFDWPSGAGSASGIRWYAAMTDPEYTALIGVMDVFEFGWQD